MNEKLSYAEMLEIPVNSCSITYKAKKRNSFKRKKETDEKIKNAVIEKVNDNIEVENNIENSQIMSDEVGKNEVLESQPKSQILEDNAVVTIKKSEKKKFKFTAIGIEIGVIVALIGTIFITNAVLPNSGINSVISKIFGTNTTEVVETDTRIYSEFNPSLPAGNFTVTMKNGYISVDGTGSIYPACDGTISSIIKEDNGKYDIEITHSENFKSIYTGLEYVYAENGSKVYANFPVGYAKGDDLKMCFLGEDNGVIANYTLSDNSVVWSV